MVIMSWRTMFSMPRCRAGAISERSDALSPSVVENLVVLEDESYEADIRNLFPKNKENQNHGDERDPHAVFNVLDMVLVETMERLKKLRESFRMVSRCSFHQGMMSVLHSGFRFASDGDGALIRMLCSSGKIKAALELHSNLLGGHMVPDLYTHNFLMNGLCKMGDLLTATFLLERMAGVGVFPNTVTYNTLIEGYCRWDHLDKALDLVSSMSQSGISPDIVTCNILVHALCTKGLQEEIHTGKLAEILEEHFEESNVITSTILMDGCCRQGDIIQALEVWNEMFGKGIRIDRIAFNVLINGFCLVLDMKVAYRYFSEMFKRGFLPDVVTFNTLISGFARKGSIHEACVIHNRMELDGLRPDAISYKLVIQALCKQGNITEAFSFLHKMLNDHLTPDRRTWNLILTSYARHGDISGAYSTRDMMVAMGVVPNVFTYNALIHANVKAGNIRQALLLKKEMLTNGIFPDAVTYNLLIEAAFNSEHNADPLIPKIWKFQPDIFTYTMWIGGLCQQRRIREAGMMFNKLLRSGLPIDHVPFQILIKSYCKRGKVIEALDLYEKMMRKQIVCHFSLYRSLFIALRKSRYYVDASEVPYESWPNMNAGISKAC
ncbi:pentatricopeptide repeat-containing protein At5g24830-like isoform X1 [Asparagus officinalis]|uniref:pentatricopeptide repeat-containing protein At5g24830-like isoform X1 n=1 Tax=Asparagus officinalis TaxID=4686 RepID=UPI00098E1F8E|nr:pentatricopeptide repeat-containing protein At5g24830-like isoform X1 [Asparagus officinalis]